MTSGVAPPRFQRTRPASAELGRAPGRFEALGEHRRQLVDRDALLLERVAIADRDRLVVERLVVDRHAPRRPDLVLAAVALADRPALVVLGLHPLAQHGVELVGDLGLAVLLDE